MKKIAITLALLGAGACSHMPEMPKLGGSPFEPVAAAPTPAASDEAAVAPVAEPQRDNVSLAIDLLGAGRAADARSALQAALEKSPRNATALSLMKQLDSDPVALLGAESDDYVVQAGDTMSGLAQRFTGDPLMFYVLSRYNNLAAPNALAVGRTIKAPRTKAAAAKAGAPAAAPAPAPAIEAKAVDPAKANAMRLQALQLLNTGEAKRAVVLLKQAQALHSTDEAIKRDLERAQRIEAALADG